MILTLSSPYMKLPATLKSTFLLITLTSLLFTGCGGVSISMDASSPTNLTGTTQPAPDSNQHTVTSALINPPMSLEELSFHSEVIARVKLLSAEPAVLFISGEPQAAFKFHFEAIEYLKGKRNGKLTVIVLIEWLNDRSVEQEQQRAEYFFKHRDSRWDDREAILFLRPTKLEVDDVDVEYMEFPTRFEYISAKMEQYSISSAHTKAWLPSVHPGHGAVGKGDANALGNAATPELRYFTDLPQSVDAAPSKGSVNAASFISESSIALSGIEQLIKTHEELLAKGRDIQGYEECVRASFAFDAHYRENPPTPYTIEIQIASGRPKGHPIWRIPENVSEGTDYYNKWWITGPDANLFHYNLVDPDNDPTTGYHWRRITTRPIPQGLYRIIYKNQPADWVVCDYNPGKDFAYMEGLVTVSAPAGALHEAFFDPVALGDAVGADGASGVLKPAAFAFDGNDAAIERIDWLDGQVRMALSPHSALADHHIDFIALDGSIALRLDFDNAVQVADTNGGQTLVWGVCEQPWRAGDLLMLRISESPTDLVGATFNAVCAPSAEATPEPTATNTPEPTPTQAPPPILTPIPTLEPISAPKTPPTPEPVDTATPTRTP